MHRNDFRNKPYNLNSIVFSGKYSGNRFYYKLFIIENLIRIILHTILTNESPSTSNWWNDCVPNYLKKPWHRRSPHHGVYHLFLKDLIDILRRNRPLIEPHVSNFNELILEIELFNNARRKIAHTKYLNADDLDKLDNLYSRTKSLIKKINLRFNIEIPI